MKSQQRRIHFCSHLARCFRKRCLEGSQTEGLFLGGCWPEATLGAWPPCWHSSGPPGCPLPAGIGFMCICLLDEITLMKCLRLILWEKEYLGHSFGGPRTCMKPTLAQACWRGHGRVHTGGRERLYGKHKKENLRHRACSFP